MILRAHPLQSTYQCFSLFTICAAILHLSMEVYYGLCKSEHLFPTIRATVGWMKLKDLTAKQKLSVQCPTCGSAPGQKCELSAGGVRNSSHRERKFAAADAAQRPKPRNLALSL